jgi:hypothetical protein
MRLWTRQVLGRLLGLSDTILGLTILSWGGSLGGMWALGHWRLHAADARMDRGQTWWPAQRWHARASRRWP